MTGLWNKYQGIIVTLVTLAAIESLAHTPFRILNPPMLLMLAIIVATSVGGTRQGLISATIAWLYNLYYLAIPGRFLHYTDDNFQRIILLTFTIPATAILVGILKRKADRSDEIARGKELLEEEMADRKKVEEKLREGEEQLRAVLENAGDAIVGIRPPGVIFIWNNKAEEIYGYSRTDAIGRNYPEIIVPERYRREALNGLERFFQSGAGPVIGKTLAHTGLRKDGTEFPVELTVTALKAGGEWQAIGVVRDITERRKVETERSRYREFLEKSLNELYVFDAETLRFEFVNAGACRNLGYSIEALRSMTPLDLKPDFTEGAFRALLEPLLRHEQEKIVFFTVHRRADGSLYDVEVHLQLFDQYEHRVFFAVILDITERKKAEEELKMHRDHLEELVHARTAELQEKTEHLARLNQAFVGRELRMKELKERIRELET